MVLVPEMHPDDKHIFIIPSIGNLRISHNASGMEANIRVLVT